jgi:hypothetical protein
MLISHLYRKYLLPYRIPKSDLDLTNILICPKTIKKITPPHSKSPQNDKIRRPKSTSFSDDDLSWQRIDQFPQHLDIFVFCALIDRFGNTVESTVSSSRPGGQPGRKPRRFSGNKFENKKISGVPESIYRANRHSLAPSIHKKR